MTYWYRHLTAEDRAAIMMMRATHSIRAIAAHLNRAPSAIATAAAVGFSDKLNDLTQQLWTPL